MGVLAASASSSSTIVLILVAVGAFVVLGAAVHGTRKKEGHKAPPPAGSEAAGGNRYRAMAQERVGAPHSDLEVGPGLVSPIAPQATATVERRQWPRVAAARPVVLRRGGGADRPTRTFAVDVSAGGMLLAGPADLAVGEEISLDLDVGEDEMIAAHGTVVRETSQGYKGMRFERVSPQDAERLGRFVSSELSAMPRVATQA